MSSAAYGILTNERDDAAAGTSETTQPPGVKTFVDAVAALVPSEVLALHAVIISYTNETKGDTTRIIDAGTLYWSFFGLLLVSMAAYFVPRFIARKWDRWDFLRIFIPPGAFIGWTMLQPLTAFDAVFPNFVGIPRIVAALFVAVALGLAALLLAYRADQKTPTT
jgi:cadmium resistance protein CadD (predicted permease)